jgi:hypothetical protein
MAVEEVIKDEYSDENFAPEGEAALLGEAKNVQLGDAFRKTDVDSFEVGYNQKERLKNEALEILPTLKKENEQLKLDNAKYKIDLEGKALPKIDEKPLVNVDTSSLSSFATSVGDSFMNLASVIPNKIEEISNDPKKKKNFMRGLEIIEASSGIKPIGQAKSTVGAISSGLLKAEKGFIAKDLAEQKNANERLKALKSGRNVLSPTEQIFYDGVKDYNTKFKSFEKEFKATQDIYSLARKAALDGKDLPTGKVNAMFKDVQAFIVDAGFGSELDALLKRNDGSFAMKGDNQVVFQNMLDAAVKQKIVGSVKELYPVSNKDIEILLQTVGDISTDPESLRRLIAAQMTTKELMTSQKGYTKGYLKEEDGDFVEKSFKDAEVELANKFRKGVKYETLEKLFGKGIKLEDVTDSGIISAHYYQTLLPGGGNEVELTKFQIYEKDQAEKDKNIIDQITDFQKTLEDGKADLPPIPPGGEPN